MKNENYEKFQSAKELIKTKKYEEAHEILKLLIEEEPNDCIIRFEFAKNLLKVSKKNILQAREYFESLLNTKNKTYAMLELGRLEFSEGNIEKARKYFESLLNTQSKTYAILELGRLEFSKGNIEKARKYFESLLNTQSKTYAILELGRLEFNEGDIEKARKYFESLLNTQSKTYAILELGRLEFSEGNIEKAREYFESLLNTQSKTYALQNLLDLCIFENKYDEALCYLDYLTTNNFIESKELKKYKFYICLKLNKLKKKPCGYFENQIINYSSSEAITHIKLHLDENDEKDIHSLFYSNIDIEQLFYTVLMIIKNKKPCFSGIIDKYIIKLDYDIGVVKGKETNKLEVITITKTKNIISMYPVLNNYLLKEEYGNQKTKKSKYN